MQTILLSYLATTIILRKKVIETFLKIEFLQNLRKEVYYLGIEFQNSVTN